jgi:hypothetical protein
MDTKSTKVTTPEVRPDWLRGANPQAIERQEKAGQASLAASTQLPIEGSEYETWAAVGIEFGAPTDKLFREASLPPGWKKVPTDHDMYTDLVDEFGRKRGSIFYKAAFYDRRAELRPGRCVNVVTLEDGVVGVARQTKAGPVTLFRTDERAALNAIALHESYALADKWMRENYPNFADPLAYWDE